MARKLARKPLIGISSSGSGSWGWRFCRFIVTLSGGIPVLVAPSKPPGKKSLDGLIVTGGADIDPSLYGHSPHTNTIHIEHERDAMEMELLKTSLSRAIPILGICRGMQMINVFFGGTLHQHIFDFDLEHPHPKTVLPKKKIFLSLPSTLHDIMRQTECRVNALHHQAVDMLGKNLRIAALDKNKIIQAIEHETLPFVIGVQWHPEYIPQQPEQRRLFSELVKTARQRGD